MKISFNTLPGNLTTNNGYGVAGFNIVTALQQLGHTVPYRDSSAPVQLNFCQPQWYDIQNRSQYHIGYVPWESTKLPDQWIEPLKECDEVWTTSRWCADVFEENGIKVSKVYPHGIGEPWTNPTKRERGRALRFLHHGAPAPRKGGDIALEAFLEAFGDRKDVSLTIKSFGPSRVHAPGDHLGRRIRPDSVYKNVFVDTRKLPEEQVPGVYHDHDVLVYPSWGEGYGLIPLQGMATGMPVICTSEWADYRDDLIPSLWLDSERTVSPWQKVHPGDMYKPDIDHLVKLYLRVDKHFDRYSEFAYRHAPIVKEIHSWTRVTAQAFRDIVKKFS